MMLCIKAKADAQPDLPLLLSETGIDCHLVNKSVSATPFHRVIHLDDPSATMPAVDGVPAYVMPLQLLLSNRRWITDALLVTQSGDAQRAQAICRQLQRHGFTAVSVGVEDIAQSVSQVAQLKVLDAARLLMRDASMVALVSNTEIDSERLRGGWFLHPLVKGVKAEFPGVLVVEDAGLIEQIHFDGRVIVLDGRIGDLVDYVAYSAKREQLHKMAICHR